MSKYTTEVRFICETMSGLDESAGYNDTNSVISSARNRIFNFDYPIFDEAYRPVLETKILKHYYTREIGEETVGLWKLRLDTRLNEIMPYYNKLYESELIEFNPLHTSNITRDHKRDNETNKNENETTNINTDVTNSSQVGSTSTDLNYNLYSDTPQGALTGVNNESYLTNATKTTDNATNSTNASSTGNTDTDTTRGLTDKIVGTEDYLEHVIGYDNKIPSDLLNSWRDTFLNIDVMIIKDLEDLFIQLW